MHSFKDIRENPERFKLGWLKRGLYEEKIPVAEALSLAPEIKVPLLELIMDLDKKRRDLLYRVEEIKRLKNEASKEIGKCKKEGRDTAPIIGKMQGLGEEEKQKTDELRVTEENLNTLLVSTPNIPAADVPPGDDESFNQIVRSHGTPAVFQFEPLPHYELGGKLGMMDFDRAGKISGSRFSILFDDLALLEWSLMRFMLDQQMSKGYRLTLPPFLINGSSMFGTGQLPKFAEDAFKCEKWDLYLAPTAEVPVTNFHRDEILEGSQLPIRYCAYTPCFRSEAGSYGKDMKGLIRQHQFNKVELVKFTLPEKSEEEHQSLLSDAEEILRKLQIPYRVSLLCSRDMGFSAEKCYDIEVWLPSEKRFREISSCSNFGDFQARRANIRFRRESTGKLEFVHTLNGSGLAVGRTLIAVMENFQQEDGSISVPEVLRPYLGKDLIKRQR
ncbi:MAG: serine--tRNA ligase [Candidatus Wallbacteria bacterium]|nr:serine--tRNA ligase [Candidatus Wallbacteria bacterium]